jgi:hypothetical protein
MRRVLGGVGLLREKEVVVELLLIALKVYWLVARSIFVIIFGFPRNAFPELLQTLLIVDPLTLETQMF